MAELAKLLLGLRIMVLQPVAPSEFPWRTWLVVTLWFGCAAVGFADQTLNFGYALLSAAVVPPSLVLIASLAAITFERGRWLALPVAAAFLTVHFAISLIALVIGLVTGGTVPYFGAGLLLWEGIALCVFTIRTVWRGRSRFHTAAATGCVALVCFALFATDEIDEAGTRFSMAIYAAAGGEMAYEEETRPPIESDAVWEAQPKLLTEVLGRMPERKSARPGYFVIAVAPQGVQKVFSREARKALEVWRERHGDDVRFTALLSNDLDDLRRFPLATRGNLATVIAGTAGALDPMRDVMVVYLTSHGSDDGSIETNLPDYQNVRALTADKLDEALDRAGIRRRIVIVSACHSGSWIEPLKDENTIVVAAAHKDRSSFGCSDDRELTFFGEAFLEGSLAESVSLADAFASAKRKIARWEQASVVVPSLPQVYVGANMQELWNAPVSPVAASGGGAGLASVAVEDMRD